MPKLHIPLERKSLSGASLSVRVTNDTSFAVTQCWADYGGAESPNHTTVMKPGKRAGMTTYLTHVFVYRRADTKAEVACVDFLGSGEYKLSEIIAFCKASRSFRIPPERKSTYDPKGTLNVAVKNDLNVSARLTWINYKGGLRLPGQRIPVGGSYRMRTNTEHPFSVTSDDGKTELACVMFRKNGDVRLSDAVLVTRHGTTAGGESLSRSRQTRRRKLHNVVDDTQPVAKPKERKGLAIPGVGLKTFKGHSNCKGKVYEVRHFSGFRCFVEKNAFGVRSELKAKIQGDLAEIARVLPEHAVALLRKKAFVWFNLSNVDGKGKPIHGACCHWSAGWLRNNGQMPEKEGHVEIHNIQHYLDWQQQPAMLLHEMAHAYHKWAFKTADPFICSAYAKAMKSGKYDRSEYFGRRLQDKRPYAATNKAEFFAETCEAFFSSRRFRNDYFPYVHAELRGYDPIAYSMVECAFGVEGSKIKTRAEFPADWKAKLVKCDLTALRGAFRKADASKTGKLDRKEFLRAAQLVAVGLDQDELSAAVATADANNDGSVDLNEFLAWVASAKGSKLKT